MAPVGTVLLGSYFLLAFSEFDQHLPRYFAALAVGGYWPFCLSSLRPHLGTEYEAIGSRSSQAHESVAQGIALLTSYRDLMTFPGLPESWDFDNLTCRTRILQAVYQAQLG